MSLKKIPFQRRFETPLLEGRKTCTSRPRRMGDEGDIFKAYGQTFEITFVEHIRLGLVAEQLYEQEGCDSPEDFIEVWRSIHPRRGYVLGDPVWVHHFKKLEVQPTRKS